MFLPSPTGPPLKVGIIRSSSIGDVILASACLHLLARLNVAVEVTWLGRQPALGLLQTAFPSLRCVELPPRYHAQGVISQLADLHFLLDLQTNLRSRVLGRAFKKLYGRPVYMCAKSYFQRGRLVLEGRMYGRRRELPAKALHALKPQFELMTEALQAALRRQLPAEACDALHEGPKAVPSLPTAHDEQRRPWQQELQFGRWLAIAPGASYETKRAPLSLFATIIRRVRERYYGMRGEGTHPLGLLLLGDGRDRNLCVELLAELGWNDPVLNLAGKLSLWESALALESAAALLSNDSGLCHLAEAVATPAAVLFGPTVEGFGFAPRMASSRAFSAALGCRPCSKHGKTPCRFMDHLCFHDIPSEEVAQHLVSLVLQPAAVQPHPAAGRSSSPQAQEVPSDGSEPGPFSCQ